MPVSVIRKTYQLKYPIEYGERTITELNIRVRLKGSDVEHLATANSTDSGIQTTIGDHYPIIANLADEPVEVIREMDLEDIEEVMSIVNALQKKR